jgi:hypothetical protein
MGLRKMEQTHPTLAIWAETKRHRSIFQSLSNAVTARAKKGPGKVRKALDRLDLPSKLGKRGHNQGWQRP